MADLSNKALALLLVIAIAVSVGGTLFTLDRVSLDAYCTKHGVSEVDLLAEADRQDLNVALLDDMIEQRNLDERKQATGDA